MKLLKNNIKLIIGIIIGAILAGEITYAAISASEVEYIKDGTEIKDVGEALNDLYSKVPIGEKEITKNGNYDVSNYATVNVNIDSYAILETGTFTSPSVGSKSYVSTTYTLKNSYTTSQNAIFVITKHKSETANSAFYIRMREAFGNYVSGNKVSFYVQNYGSASGTVTFDYAVIQKK